MRWEIHLERRTQNRLNPEITQRKLRSIVAIVGENADLAFEGHIPKLREPVKVADGYLYTTRISVVNRSHLPDEILNSQYRAHIYERLKFQILNEKWTILKEKSVGTDIPSLAGVGSGLSAPPQSFGWTEEQPRPPMVLPELDDEAYRTHFAGVYEREAHIRMVHDSVKAFVRSKGEQRSHLLLEGRPACCKTVLMERFKLFYEGFSPEVERVVFVDGPTMSKAGLENWILDMARNNALPEIIGIEEIEKQPMDNLLTLLSVMGSGYIMKTNARIGRVREHAKCLIWATCNDKQALKKFRDGALWSRFVHRLHCRGPSKDLMLRIVQDRIEKIGGNPKWAKKVIEFAYDVFREKTGRPIEDPRTILGLLDGEDRLLDGSYQEDYLSTISDDDDEQVNANQEQ